MVVHGDIRLPFQVVEKLVYVDRPVEKVLLPGSARAIVRCSHRNKTCRLADMFCVPSR